MKKPIVLTIAGLDPSSGAGLTADIRTFENIGVYSMSVCTAITIQNAQKVEQWFPVEPDQIRKQLDIIFTSYDVNYVKTGMLGSINAVEIVAEYQKKYNFNLIIDPVIISGSGKRIAEENIEKAMKEQLFPLTTVLTPNKHEAELFSGKNITDAQSVQDVGAVLRQLGPKHIIIKGGHIDEEGSQIVDYYYSDAGFSFHPRERVDLGNFEHIHGTGCVFSSLITGFLSLGYNIEESLLFTENDMERAFENIFPLKKGAILDTGHTNEELETLKEVQKVMDFICGNIDFTKFIPEVKTNVAICTPNAQSLKDIAAIDGRITSVSGVPVAAGPIRFNVSNHTGRLILTAKKLDPSYNAVINIKFTPETLLKLQESNLSMIEINRLEQTKAMSQKENSTMNWAVQNAFEKLNKIPDIIWDQGEPEKEPMIRLFAKTATDLIQKIKLFINLV